MKATRTKTRAWSIRRTLLAVLLGLTLVLWASSAVIVYFEAERESRELFDGALAETAHLLLSLAENEVREHGLEMPTVLPMTGRANPNRYMMFQVLDAGGMVLYRNDGAPDVALARGAPDGLSWTTIAGERWRLYTLWNGDRTLRTAVAEPTSHREDISSRFFHKILVFGTLLALVAGAGIWWTIHRVFRVLQESANEVAARTPNDLADVNLRGVPGEAYPLMLAINRLFGRVRRTMEYEQRFTADAAHELRTPLAAIKTNLQVLQRARSAAERDEFIAGLGVSVDRAGRLVDQLLTLAQLDPQAGADTALEPGDLAGLLAEGEEGWRAACAGRGLELTVDGAPAPCAMQPDAMRMLLRNLVDNAMRYTPAPGRIVVACGHAEGRSWLRVADSGPGIEPALRERVFERFVRLAGSHAPGSGLGLSIVRRIADRHGATIRLGTGLAGAGLEVVIEFSG